MRCLDQVSLLVQTAMIFSPLNRLRPSCCLTSHCGILASSSSPPLSSLSLLSSSPTPRPLSAFQFTGPASSLGAKRAPETPSRLWGTDRESRGVGIAVWRHQSRLATVGVERECREAAWPPSMLEGPNIALMLFNIRAWQDGGFHLLSTESFMDHWKSYRES